MENTEKYFSQQLLLILQPNSARLIAVKTKSWRKVELIVTSCNSIPVGEDLIQKDLMNTEDEKSNDSNKQSKWPRS